MITGKFPNLRLRRSRKHSWSRRLIQENNLSSNDFIYPIFLIEGKNKKIPIKSMPGIYKHTIDKIGTLVGNAIKNKIPMVALFPSTPNKKKDYYGKEALNENNLVCRATRYIKKQFKNDIGVMCDVALDPYTSHGHDGLLKKSYVLNDETIEILKKQSLLQAEMGCDVIAPSDMMDGRIGKIRKFLDKNGYHDVQLLSYAVKYASNFYGPFRDAIGSKKSLKSNKKNYVLNDKTIEILKKQSLIQAEMGCDVIAPSDMMDGRIGKIRKFLDKNNHHDVQLLSYAVKYASNFYGPFRDAIGSKNSLMKNKKNYQMDFANSNESMREVALDIKEGADMVMVKPGMPYLDIIRSVKDNFKIPVLAYQVSGEYSLIKNGIKNKLIKEDAIIESLICFKRAGASAIISYFAMDISKKLKI